MANALSIVRIVCLIFASVFAIITLGLAADITNTTETLPIDDFYFIFSVLAIATSVLTIMTLPVCVIIDSVRTGAFTSMVVVELVWFTILWILWLSTAADAANTNNNWFPNGCGFVNQKVDSTCREFSGVVAFSFLAWIVLFGYTITLFVFTLIGQNKGHKAWTTSVKQADFLAPGPGLQTGGQTTGQVMTTVPPEQYQYPPQVAPSVVSAGVPPQSYPHGYSQSPAPSGYSSPQQAYAVPHPPSQYPQV